MEILNTGMWTFETRSHVIEPKFPAAVDRYVNLGQFYDIAPIKAARDQVVARTEAYQAAYQRAFHCLKAARQVEVDANACLQSAMDWARADRRITGVIARELRRKGGGPGKVSCRFLGGMTHQGYVWRFDSVDLLCPRVYELADRGELGSGVLLRLRDAATAAGHDVIACLNPEDMGRIQHLLVPGLGLGFVTSNEQLPYPGKPYRRIRLDAMTEVQDRPRLRFARRMTEALREEAWAALREAKTEHDALEAIYNPHVDFEGVRSLAEQETQRILGYLKG